MEPSNQKVLYHELMDTIKQLKAGTIKVATAVVVSDCAARVNTAVKLEHDRQRIIMEIESHKFKFPHSDAQLRNIEGKNFE